MERLKKIPHWLRVKIPAGQEYVEVRKTLSKLKLNTVCFEARCPNIGECFCNKTATFLLLGTVCTRNCRYCAVHKGKPHITDYDEPQKVANAVKQLGIDYVVITSVTRDDLDDGGAFIFSETVRRIRNLRPNVRIEILVPDFLHSHPCALEIVYNSQPDVFAHNIEVVKKMFPTLRPQGNYDHSLAIIKKASSKGLMTKSGLMVGFGETMDDVRRTLEDLLSAGVRIITVGQYLQSHRNAYPVIRYYRPEEFEEIKCIALQLGFEKVLCGPLVRSSYLAEKLFK